MSQYLRLFGPFHNAASGYSKMTRAVLRTALLAGYTVQAVESDYRMREVLRKNLRWEYEREPQALTHPLPEAQWAEVQIALHTEIPEESPTLLIQLPAALNQRGHFPRGPRIGWTMGESDRIGGLWAHGCRGVDTLLLPSPWCLDAFRTRLPTMDLRVLPLPVDDRLFSVEGPSAEAPKRPPFLFFAVFATNERKQWRLLMHAFAEEFGHESRAPLAPPEVGLLVKPTRLAEVQELAIWCMEAGAWIQIDEKVREDHELAQIYRSIQCYVLPSCEGFGLPFVEAGLCGLPSIALNAGGAAEIVTDENGYRLPTHRGPLIGHQPAIYPLDHQFALTTVPALRKALRQAVEDQKTGVLQAKGKQAQEDARRFTPAALSDRFREEIERACVKRRTVTLSPGIPARQSLAPQTALAFGAWGDVIASVGMARKWRDPNRPLHILHYGHDPKIAEFLELQGLFEKIIRVPAPADPRVYRAFFARACQTRRGVEEGWIDELLEGTGINRSDVLFTQINQTEDNPLCRWHEAKLPTPIRAWARTQARCWGDFYFLHPISTQSALLSEHWPYWVEAIHWLVQETPYTYVLTGQMPLDLPDSPRLIDLTGRTESMLHVLALAEESKGVIATCNALSLWTIVQNIPGFICANGVFDEREDYYHRWVNCPPNTLLYRGDPLTYFVRRVQEWQERIESAPEKPAYEGSELKVEVSA